MDLTINGHPVLEGSITIPRIGVWSACVRVDSAEALSGAVVLSTQEGDQLRGFITRGGNVVDGRVTAWVIGGAGGLGRTLEPRHYRAPLARLPLLDLVREAEEELSDSLSTATQELLRAPLRAWTRDRCTVTQSLKQFTEALGLAWRVLLDGKLWIGRETWPEVQIAGLEVLRDEPALGRVEVAAVSLPAALVPGVVWSGERVSLVEHQISERRSRTIIHFEREGAESDRLRRTFEAAVRAALPFHAYARVYVARVVQQMQDGTLELVFDDSRMPAMSGVPLRLSIPGSLKIAANARVLVGFENADPQRPYASLFESGSIVEAKLGNATRGVAREGDAVELELMLEKDSGKVTKLFARRGPGQPEIEITTDWTAVPARITGGSLIVKAE